MATIRMRLSASHIDAIAVIPMSHLGPLWGPFCTALRGAGGTIVKGQEPRAPQDQCGAVCKALRAAGFNLTGSPAALDLARAQGYIPSTPAPPAQAPLPFPAAAGACPFPETAEPVLRLEQNDLESWAHAGLNVLVASSFGTGAGPSKFDRPFLTACFVKITEHGGLTDEDWRKLCTRLRKYHKQIGAPPNEG